MRCLRPHMAAPTCSGQPHVRSATSVTLPRSMQNDASQGYPEVFVEHKAVLRRPGGNRFHETVHFSSRALHDTREQRLTAPRLFPYHCAFADRDIVPLGAVKSKFNFNLDEKRVLNFENVVNDDDNIKQDMSIDVYGRKDQQEAAEEEATPANAEVHDTA